MRLVRRLIEVGALKFGDFILSSGKRSNVYVDIKLAITYPDILEMIAEGIAEILKRYEFERVACIELGGVPIATAVSLKTRKPLVIFRKEQKSYGLGGDLIGEIKEGEKIVVIEDVITTGKSALSVAERVRKRGGKVATVVAVVDREESGMEFESVLKLSDLIKAKNLFDPPKS
ncbi:MAG: orotate phosphoribosyltransferase [Archaeoglobaceae archaeon]|nr:orotate phosphoribosyltransferase [Archaeoglobaceae archaeon]MDW8117429.1 orotate phosphoribosyltransferase [Archaeoglobaceae archaeon]